MTWWEVVTVFVGIPIGVVVTIAVLVYRLTDSRVPDGIATAIREREAQQSAAEGDEEANDEGAS